MSNAVPPEVAGLILRFQEVVSRAVEPDLHVALVHAPGPGSHGILESRGLSPPVPSGWRGGSLVAWDALPTVPSWGAYHFGDPELYRLFRSIGRQAASVVRSHSPELRTWFDRLMDNIPGDEERAAGLFFPIEPALALLDRDPDGAHTESREWRPGDSVLRRWPGDGPTPGAFRLVWVLPDVFTLCGGWLTHWAVATFGDGAQPGPPEPPGLAGAGTSGPAPEWDGAGLRLTFGGVVCLQGSRLADCQDRILEAFQAAGWPKSIPTPLDSGKATRDVVAKLNGRLRGDSPIRFRCGPGAREIGWGPAGGPDGPAA